MEGTGTVIGILIVILAPIAYIFPWLIARDKKHHNRNAILAVNVLLGWTFIGWVWALVWALSNPSPRAEATTAPQAPSRACLTCGRITSIDARFCPGCGTAAPTGA